MVTVRVQRDENIVVDESDTYEGMHTLTGDLAATYSGVMDGATVKLRTADQDGNRQGYDNFLDSVWEIDPGTEFARKTTLREQQKAAGKMHFATPKPSQPPAQPQPQPVLQGASPLQAPADMLQQLQAFMAAATKQAEVSAAVPLPLGAVVTTSNPPKRVTFVSQSGEEIIAEYADVLVEELVIVLVGTETGSLRFFPKNPETRFSIKIDSFGDELFVIRPSGVCFDHNGFTYCLLARVQV